MLYIAENLATAVAEAIIRDRFEGATERLLTAGEVAAWGAAEVHARSPLSLLDLRTDGCFLLGVSTDIMGAKAQNEAREFSQTVYDQTAADGVIYLPHLTRKTCVAVYDRAVGPKLGAGPVHELETLAALVPSLSALRVVLV